MMALRVEKRFGAKSRLVLLLGYKKETITQASKSVLQLIRQVVAVLGTIYDLKRRIWIVAVACGYKRTQTKWSG